MAKSFLGKAKDGLSGNATARRVAAAERAAQSKPRPKARPKKKKSPEASVRDVFWGGE